MLNELNIYHIGYFANSSLNSFGPSDILGCASFIVLIVVIIIIIKKMMHISPAIGEVSTAIDSIIDDHLSTLTIEKRKLLVPDKYGHRDTTRWDQELLHFSSNIGTPYVLQKVSNEAVIAYQKRMIQYENTEFTLKDVFTKSTQLAAASSERIAIDIIDRVESRIVINENKKPQEGHNAPIEYTTPTEFEEWCAEQLRIGGWDATVQGQSGDQGVDVRAIIDGITLALQCKYYTNPVGNKAVQEIYSGKSFISADMAAVVTTSDYTKSARALAQQTGVYLLLPDELATFSPDGKD